MSILLIAESTPGKGGGHRMRCRMLAAKLPPATVVIDASDANVSNTAIAKIDTFNATGTDLIVIDKPWVTRHEIRRWGKQATVLGLDSGGSGRVWCDWLVDTLPRVDSASGANIADSALLPLPSRRRSTPPTTPRRVLLSFGAEDHANLTTHMVHTLLDGALLKPEAITIVRGPWATPTSPDGTPSSPTDNPHVSLRTLTAPDNLRELLADYDVVFCSFGFTAYEAAAAGCAVIVCNPSRYHLRLTRAAGFAEVGIIRPNRRRLARLLADIPAVAQRSTAIVPSRRRDLAIILRDYAHNHAHNHARNTQQSGCPLCGTHPNRAIARFAQRTYCRCANCTMDYLISARPNRQHYDEDYFDAQYRAQYGKSYLEDYIHIRTLGITRARRINRLLRLLRNRRHRRNQRPRAAAQPLTLLDVGCAYGPFLDAARAVGFAPMGIDPCEPAIHHVRRHLSIPAYSVRFEDLDLHEAFQRPRIDSVSMWFVVEHFSQLDPVLRTSNRLPTSRRRVRLFHSQRRRRIGSFPTSAIPARLTQRSLQYLESRHCAPRPATLWLPGRPCRTYRPSSRTSTGAPIPSTVAATRPLDQPSRPWRHL